MMREWRRLYRLRGFAPFGMLLVALLAALVVVDRAAERWTDAAQRREAAERKLAPIRATLERGRRIDALLESARARLAAVSGKVVNTSDPALARNQLAQATRRWLVSLEAAPKSEADRAKRDAQRKRNMATAAPARAPLRRTDAMREASGMVTTEVAARLSTRQLLRALETWREAPFAMRLVRLEVTVDNSQAPTTLETTMRVQGLYQGPAPAAGVGRSETRASAARNAR